MSTPSLQLRLSMEQVEPRTYDICENRHKGSAESVAANPSDDEKTKGQIEALAFIKSKGLAGATAKEFAEHVGKSVNCVSGRFAELKASGLVFPHHQRRGGSSVWIAGV